MPKRKPPKVGKGSKLTMAQELFCYFFTGLYFNNAVRSYAAAYNINLDEYERLGKLTKKEREQGEFGDKYKIEVARYKVAAAGGQENLEKPLIQERIKQRLLDKFNDLDQVDARHSQIIFGGADTDSIAAIRELNKLKGRITDKLDVKGTFSLTELLKEADKE